MFDENRVRRIDTPVQIASQDEVLKEWEFGGPHCDRDVRLILDVETLGVLFDIAKSCPTKRVIIPKAGFRVKLRRASTGHCYETLHVSGCQPIPEQAPTSFKMELPTAQAQQLVQLYRK